MPASGPGDCLLASDILLLSRYDLSESSMADSLMMLRVVPSTNRSEPSDCFLLRPMADDARELTDGLGAPRGDENETLSTDNALSIGSE